MKEIKRRKKEFNNKPGVGETNYPWLFRTPFDRATASDYKHVPQQEYAMTRMTVVNDDEVDENYREMYTIEDALVSNRHGYRYSWAVARQSLPHLQYTTLDFPPYQARASYEDRSAEVLLSHDAMSVSTNDGFRSARANVNIRQGDWYFEVNVIKANDKRYPDAHVRFGVTRREAEIEAPVGYDAYGYGFRDVNGEKVHISRPKSFLNEPVSTGDVIGIRVCIPRNEDYKNIPVYRDRYPLKKKNNVYFEAIEYVGTKKMSELLLPNELQKQLKKVPTQPVTIPGSFIQVYKNGKDMGVAFTDLIEFMPPYSEYLRNWQNRLGDDGFMGYFPTISVFRGGIAEFNFGPNFATKDFPSSVRPLCERYYEMIGEDVLQDVIDEVDFELQETRDELRKAAL
ncbi:hypothetical protein TRVA0_093S00144 [Trichomonascus vanleenenianus]|uniref:Bre2p n=1 Tax=Trichomonascus vanleenenianus TaxID=2268995 RepID=UPI003ECA222C